MRQRGLDLVREVLGDHNVTAGAHRPLAEDVLLMRGKMCVWYAVWCKERRKEAGAAGERQNEMRVKPAASQPTNRGMMERWPIREQARKPFSRVLFRLYLDVYGKHTVRGLYTCSWLLPY